MRSLFRLILVLPIVLGGIRVSHAQEKWEKEGEGEIKDVQIEIVKDRKIILPLANRNFEKVPPRPYEPIKPPITYTIKPFDFSSPDYKPAIRPLKLKQEEIGKLNGNYLSAGGGNYASFFLEGDVSTKRDKNKLLGAYVNAKTFGKGPVNDENSASAATLVRLYGKLTGSSMTLHADLTYLNRVGYFYGGPAPEPNRDKIKQSYNDVGVALAVSNTKRSDFNYRMSAGYSYLSDNYKAREGLISLSFNSDYKVDEKSAVLVAADYYLIDRTDSLANPGARHLLRVKPYYQFSPIENLSLTVGVNLALQNDQYAGSKDFHFYPHARADYKLSEAWSAYGVFTGDMDKVDLHRLASENIWVGRDLTILHTNRAMEFVAGLNGKVGGNFAVSGGFSVASLKNYYYYLNASPYYDLMVPPLVPSTSNKFDITYDENTSRFNPFVEVGYVASGPFKLNVRADLYQYSTAQQKEAWHRPTYGIKADVSYDLYSKILFQTGLYAQGGMRALQDVPGNLSIVTLDPALDVYLGARYFVSRDFSVFVKGQNLLSSKYPLYQGYPSRGIQVMGGVSWSF